MTRGVFVASNALPASELNDCFDPPRCRVYNSANISITTSGVAQALTFDTEVEDTGAMHSTSVNTSRITIPTGGNGWYRMGGCVRFAANSTGFREVKIQANGSVDLVIQRVPNSGGTDDCRVAVHTEYPLVAGDYIELVVAQNSGGALNALASVPYSIAMYAIWSAVY
jgi:hypothetical protein